MSRSHDKKTGTIAAAALLAVTLSVATPAFAAGPRLDLAHTLTSWLQTWIEPLTGWLAPDTGPRAEPAADRSTPPGAGEAPTPIATGGGGAGQCELACGEAGVIGDPNG